MKIICLLLLLLLLFIDVLAVQAAVRYIIPGTIGGCSNGSTNYHPSSNTCSGGTDQTVYTTLGNNFAAKWMQQGDTAYIRSGTYNEEITYVVMPNGTSNGRYTIAVYPGDVVTITRDIQLADYWTLTGSQGTNLIIDGASHPPGQPISGVGTGIGGIIDHLEVKNWRTCTNYPNCDQGSGGSGVLVNYLDAGANVIIRNSSFHDNGLINDPWGFGGYGIYNGGKNTLIENNVIYNNAGYGLQDFASGEVTADNNIIRNNLFYDNFLIGGSYNMVVSSGHNKQIYGNVIIGRVNTSSTAGGIEIGGNCNNCAIYNNTFYNMVGGAIQNNSTTTWVKNNLIYKTPGNVNSGGTKNFSNNLCEFSDAFCTLSPVLDASKNNPYFVSETVPFDLHLQLSSPAINKGVTNICSNCGPSGVAVNISACGTPPGCYYGNAPDIGAYEFVPVGSVIVITSPMVGPNYITASNSVTVSGTASCATSITSVTWSNNRGGSGTATGTINWSVPNISLTADRVNDLTFVAHCQ